MSKSELLGPVPPERALPPEKKRPIKEELMAVIHEETHRTPSARRPRRRRIGLVAAVFLMVVSVGTAFAINSRPEQATSISCPDNAVIPAVSGSPVEDCAFSMRERGIHPPPMVAYTTADGAIAVRAQGEEVPDEWSLLEEGFRQDAAVIELRASLEDVATGLRADCYLADEATPIIQRELDRVDLDWTVDIRNEPDGVETCAFAALGSAPDTVTIVALQGVAVDPTSPSAILANQLHDALDSECLTLDEAHTKAQHLASDVGLGDINPTTTVDDQTECARVSVTVGGSAFVDLRGPNA